jgi:hypothetical protein
MRSPVRFASLLRFAAGVTLLCAAVSGAAPAPSASATLPDGRVYEQVSPANKNGNVVKTALFGLAAEGGDAVVFLGSGAMGAATSGTLSDYVARRSSSGWATTSAISGPLGKKLNPLSGSPLTLVPSHDFSRFLFGSGSPYVSAEPLDASTSANIFLSEDQEVEPVWVGRPVSQPPTFSPTPAPGSNTYLHDYLIVGGTPELSTVYFTYSGTLIPQDASRTPNVGNGLGEDTDPWGFYEWSDGALAEAGVLPNGTLDPFGAVPAAIAGQYSFDRRIADPFDQAQTLDNEISTGGSSAFFVSPDPVASAVANAGECAAHGPCTGATPELYVRKTAPDGSKSTVLVSQSQLSGHEGEPAPDGPADVPNAEREDVEDVEPIGASYVYGSPDGSQAFFASVDRLTSAAPSGGSVKEYDFDVNTGSLTYLPGVSAPIVVSANNGSSFLFESTSSTPAELDLWSAGPGGGQVNTITRLPSAFAGGEIPDVSDGRVSADGSVFVFRTDSPLPGGFNNTGNFEQVYRYEVSSNSLGCVSCPPVGVTPSGGVEVSYDNAESGRPNGSNDIPMTTLDTRVISPDGDRVFFDTPDPLVAQDTNGERDVYEWENGNVYLISSGKSEDESNVLDSSASGDDVFFTTSSGLAPGDVDEAYDVYDARVPRPGDNPPPSAVPCQGDVCQGPPSVPSLLGEPASATFIGAGNLTPPEAKPPVKSKRAKRKAAVHKRKRKRKDGKRGRRARRSVSGAKGNRATGRGR